MKRLFYLLFCVSLMGCGEKKPQKPANFVPDEKMVRIMADLHTAEARVERSLSYPDTALMTFNHYQKEILQQHEVTEEQFRTTYRYYLENIPEMDKLYEVIIDTLSVRESRAQARADSAALQVAAPIEVKDKKDSLLVEILE
ncbi:DUF4296 domain-containing protein [Pontibacter beigongshangensis]|uniref:DUF4296 domain-containing protein n=1 Tax=Pontibacter beigongshangensis TaxID=2574733 RepID=UPI00164EFBD7|nr:DUF4296 domain-containing protein [Pontibacter beigongshangensis]